MWKVGVYGVESDWFKSYLSGSKQLVILGNTCSGVCDVDDGALQGSLFGSATLFLLLQ